MHGPLNVKIVLVICVEPWDVHLLEFSICNNTLLHIHCCHIQLLLCWHTDMELERGQKLTAGQCAF